MREREDREGGSEQGMDSLPIEFLIQSETSRLKKGRVQSFSGGLTLRAESIFRRQGLRGHLLQEAYLGFSRQKCSQLHDTLSLPLSTGNHLLICQLFPMAPSFGLAEHR